MRATAILKEEHSVLRRVLRCLEVLVEGIQREGSLDEEAAMGVVEFLEQFTDGCHQAKEESLMQRAIGCAADADAREGMARYLRVHREEHTLLQAIRTTLERALGGDSWGFDLFVHRARDYVKLQRRHAEDEDRELFPLLDQLLEGQDEGGLIAGLERIDARYRGRSETTPDRIAEGLCTRVGLT
jgi:branched-chain amino acid transport system ATP-binding protein